MGLLGFNRELKKLDSFKTIKSMRIKNLIPQFTYVNEDIKFLIQRWESSFESG